MPKFNVTIYPTVCAQYTIDAPSADDAFAEACSMYARTDWDGISLGGSEWCQDGGDPLDDDYLAEDVTLEPSIPADDDGMMGWR